MSIIPYIVYHVLFLDMVIVSEKQSYAKAIPQHLFVNRIQYYNVDGKNRAQEN